jgi:hypothetical protein
MIRTIQHWGSFLKSPVREFKDRVSNFIFVLDLNFLEMSSLNSGLISCLVYRAVTWVLPTAYSCFRIANSGVSQGEYFYYSMRSLRASKERRNIKRTVCRIEASSFLMSLDVSNGFIWISALTHQACADVTLVTWSYSHESFREVQVLAFVQEQT